MSRLSVKYLDAETGNYEYATVIDVGDLDKLKTTVKSDLVSAINSIGITGNIPSGIQDQLDEINQTIIDVKNSGLTDTQLAEVDRSISDGVGVLAGQLKALETKVIEDNAKLQSEISEDINTKLSNVETDYNAKVKTVSDSLDSAKTDISNVASDLSNTKNRLQNAETNYTEVSTEIDSIHGELSSKVDSSEFDLMQSKVTENTTAISQTRDDISLLATKTSLDLVTDRVSKAESDIQLNSDGLTSRVTYTELNKQLENVSKFGDNLVRGTRDWDGWKTDDILKAYISNDTYRHCKIQVIEDKQYAYYTTFEDIEVGKTYTVSIYFKVKTNSDYASVNFLEGANSYALTDIEEDTTGINGWKRVSASFVPAEKTFVGTFKLSFLETDNIGYLVAPKIEIGGKASDWKPHFDDDNEVIIKNQTLIKQNSDSIATLVSTTEKQGEDISQAETKITQTSESVLAQANKIQEIEGEVSENKASIEVANQKIELKVSQTDIDKSIADITLDTKNRIVNSDFSFGFSNWNERNEKFVLKDIEGVKYASITRSGLTAVSIASMVSDKFPVKNNENLMISSDIIVDSIDGLDDKGIMSIELFNIEDVRVFSKTFNISELYPNAISNVKFRGYSKFRIDREDVSKARVKIQLNKNGSINFSKISVQKGDLNEADWIAAPEDEHLYRVETQTSIDQNAQEIVLKANKTDLDASNKKIDENTASIEIANDNISQVVTNYEAMSNRVTQAESSITQNANSITQKVSSIDVENILTGKSYATQSQLTQTSDSLTSTISSVKSDAETALQQSQNAHDKSVKSSTVTYQAWESGISVPTGVWTTSIPTVSASQYLWTRTVFTLQDDTATTSYSVSKMGENGVDGKTYYSHTAYAYSADGTDRFTTVYPNLNLLRNSLFTDPIKTTPDSNSAFYGTQSNVVGSGYVPSTSNRDLTINSLYVAGLELPIGVYTSSITIANNSETVATVNILLIIGTADTDISPIVNGNSVPWWFTALGNPAVTINIPANSTARYTFTFKAKSTHNTGQSQFIIFRETTAIPVTRFSNPKLEPGSTATPWFPSASEVKTSDYPSYIGTYSDTNINGSTDPSKYTWIVFKGSDGVDGTSPINLVIDSSNGYQFKNNIINTTFTAILYQNNKEIDSDGTKFAYIWSKTNSDGTVDTAWNLAHRTSQKSITITNSDVRQRATFDCTAESLN